MKILDKARALTISRRFYTSLVAVLVVAMQDYLGLDQQQATTIAGVLMAWIVGDSVRKTDD